MKTKTAKKKRTPSKNPNVKTDFQVSDHGEGKFSVQVFDETGKLLDDRSIVKDINGWHVVYGEYDCPPHKTPHAAAQHYTTIYHEGRVVGYDLASKHLTELKDFLEKGTTTMKEYTLPRSGNVPLKFNGELLAESKGKKEKGESRQRWYDLAVYKTKAGKYVASIAYRSDFGEPGRNEAEILDTPQAVVAMLQACDPLAPVQGYPDGEQYKGKQAKLLREITARFDEQVSAVLTAPEFAEVID